MSIHNAARIGRRYQAGISFIELVMFIVIVSVGVAGILSVMTYTTRTSADPLAQKQVLAIAESLLEEIELRPFTYCDPADPKAPTAASAADCATPEALGPEAGETRYSALTPFNNVNDYGSAASGTANALLPAGIRDVTGDFVAGLAGYSASVTVTQQAMPAIGGAAAVAAGASLRIDVRVRGPGGADVTLTGYRLRYAPNAL